MQDASPQPKFIHHYNYFRKLLLDHKTFSSRLFTKNELKTGEKWSYRTKRIKQKSIKTNFISCKNMKVDFKVAEEQ